MHPMSLLPTHRRLGLCDDGTRPVLEHTLPSDDANHLAQAQRLSQRLRLSRSLYFTLACMRRFIMQAIMQSFWCLQAWEIGILLDIWLQQIWHGEVF